jgi:hypothetical protein
MEQNKRGGEVVASGGFGCIFIPALKCENEPRDYNKISKLMTEKHANDEYKTIQQFKHVLQSIPNYSDYFLLDGFSICKPAKLTRDDLKKYNKKCKALTKKDIKARNVNSSLTKLLTLNMPNGGVDVDKFIDRHFDSANLIRLNNSLINLLVNGIVPMNKLHVYHGDIKESNMLVQTTSTGLSTGLTTRLIDWGLSFVRQNTKGIPKKIYRRPFQYNVPFSSVLFNKELVERYAEFLSENLEPDYYQIREFVINYIYIWNDIRGPGHIDLINKIFEKLAFNELNDIKKGQTKDNVIEYEFTYYYIVEYLTQILNHYTKQGKLDIMTYFNTVFLKNIDIWGFVLTYFAFYEELYKDLDSLNTYQITFLLRIKQIIIEFLYTNPLQPINVDNLVNELTKLNELIANFELTKTTGGGTRGPRRTRTNKKRQTSRKERGINKSKTIKRR